MLKTLKKMTVAAVFVLTAAATAITAAAMGFSVTTNLPENQRDTGRSSFDLLVSPGMEQDIIITIRNAEDVDSVVLVETITASTSRNGDLNYSSRGMMDQTLQFSFEDIAKVPQSYYTIPAGGSIDVPVRLTVPNEPFEGMILGSIRVFKEATEEEREAAGAIVNQYAYVTAVRLVQDVNADNIPAEFVLGELTAERVSRRASIVAYIRNTQPKLIKDAAASATIYPRGGNEAVFELKNENVSFAPNSIFPFSIVDREGRGIEAGDYTAHIEIMYEGKTWSFVEDFTITETAAAAANENAINQLEDPVARWFDDIPLWAMVGIGMGAMLMFLMVVLIARTKRQNTKNIAQLQQLLAESGKG